MNKQFKKVTALVLGAVTAAMLLASCSANDAKTDLENGAKSAVEDVKKGAEDAKNAAEDIAGGTDQQSKSKQEFDTNQAKGSEAALVGSWSGVEADGDKYTLTLYSDSTYEIREYDQSDNEKSVCCGKYSVKDNMITLSREKEKKNGKVVDNKEVDTYYYTLDNSNKLTIKEDGTVEIILNKENNIKDKIIK
ncbi:MAG: copper resistance protein NlpE N-terminal domain-containing protein [Clostridium sp.]|uniref:copper resistance protein NlpE N-terminal domain-containing protein n=1 Tax=Clostridium sp. TaxID=1506 RepID=UPI002FCADDD1